MVGWCGLIRCWMLCVYWWVWGVYLVLGVGCIGRVDWWGGVGARHYRM